MSRSVESLKAFVAGAPRDGAHRHHPGVVVFGAGKGGVGTSALAGLVALGAARAGASVLLVDADETVGSLHLMFGVLDEVPGLGSLRSGAVKPADLLLGVAPGVALLPGGGGGVDATLSIASAERRMLLRRVTELYDRYDLVVVDGGSRLDSVMASCAVASGRLVCVTTPDRVAQTAAYALLKVTRARFRNLPAELLVNRASDPAAQEVHRVVEAASSSFLDLALPYAGAVPDDAGLQDHVAEGLSLATLDASGPAPTAAAALADRLLQEDEAVAGPPVPVLPLHRGAEAAR